MKQYLPSADGWLFSSGYFSAIIHSQIWVGVVVLIKKKLDDVVYDIIIKEIVGGHYLPGYRLNPTEVAEKCSVSKTPVIQALKKMESLHILDVTSGGKYIIPEPNQTTMQDICEVRLRFEEHALLSLCSNVSADHIIILEHIAQNSRELFLAGREDEYFLEDIRFHKKIVEFAGNEIESDLFNLLMDRYLVIRSTSRHAMIHNEQATFDHLNMVEALKSGSKRDAKALIRNHFMKYTNVQFK